MKNSEIALCKDIEQGVTNFFIFKNQSSYQELSKVLAVAYNALSDYYILKSEKSEYHNLLKETIFKPHLLDNYEYTAILFQQKLFTFFNGNPIKLVLDKNFYKNPAICEGLYFYLFSQSAHESRASKNLVDLKKINYTNLHNIVEYLCLKNEKSILPSISLLYSSFESNPDYIKTTEEHFIKTINNFDTYEKFEGFMGEFNNHIYSEKKIYTEHKLKNFFFNLSQYIDNYIETRDTSYIEDFYTYNLNDKTKKYLIKYLNIYFTASSPSENIANDKKLLIDKLIISHEKSLVSSVIPELIDKKNILKI